MKPWPSTDRSGPRGAVSSEYVGRSAEEALAKAAAALGPAAELRCWKTRRGGVGGFFATEVYVAGSTPPQGAERGRGRSRREPTDGTSRAQPARTDPSEPGGAPSLEHGEPLYEDIVPDPLATLAEDTADQVSIHHEVSTAAFDALLAEATAALGPDTPLPAAACDHADLVPPPWLPLGSPEGAAIDDLRGRLAALGVPEAHLPGGERPTLDALLCAVDALPKVPALVSGAGDIVVVVGESRLVEQTAEILVGVLGLGRRDLIRCALDENDPDADRGAARRSTATKVNAAVRVAKRRANGDTSLVAVSTSVETQGASAAADVIDCIRPHRVLAAVDASAKRVDVERWLLQVGRIDALAVWGLQGTRTPGELFGTAPIAYADGTPCSALGWAATLLGRLASDGLA